MSSRRNRIWLLPFLLLAGKVWALGLGDIRLDSALNEPLRAQIELLAATPEELDNLSIQLASSDTFARYDLDRPLYLTRIRFDIVRSGRADGNYIRITSPDPITEPFVTFLVEASWSRGRLLREYTVLLDPPTFAPPPAAAQTESVTAPTRTAPADSGQITRPAPAQQAPAQPPAPVQQPPVQSTPSQPAPAQPPAPAPQVAQPQPAEPQSFDQTPGGDLVVQRGETLWGIASRVRPDSRLTMNQTMLAIFEANPQAFAGNINVLRAGAALRIPSADEIFRISRGDALVEVQRQHASWGGAAVVTPSLPDIDTQPSLTLVPPDDEDELPVDDVTDAAATDDTAIDDDFVEDTFVDPVEQRISELETLLNDQDAILSIPNNELEALRRELAELRGEEFIPDDTADDALDEDVDDVFVDEDADAVAVDDVSADDTGIEDIADAAIEPPIEAPAPAVVRTSRDEPGLVDTILGYLTNFWVIIGAALAAAVLVLVWFMRRGGDAADEDITGVWDALDADEIDTDADSVASTERLRALARDDDTSIVVVEQEAGEPTGTMETIEAPTPPTPPTTPAESPAPAADATTEMPAPDPLSDTDTNKALEDTFSSETAINLDQSDPVAEADFHMAYGLYDQAADLINGALASDPDRQDLLAKLAEIYFVWGNRDAFIDAAGRMKAQVGDGPEWDKIVIMGQQIAADHELFSGVSAEGATKAVDLSFEGGLDEPGALDMDFAAGGPDGAVSDVIDLGADVDGDGDTGQVPIAPASEHEIDFALDDEEPDLEASVTQEMPSRGGDDDATAEMPTAGDDIFDIGAGEETAETPTIEQQFDSLEPTGEMPTIETPVEDVGRAGDATAEIELDDLGLDLDGLDEVGVATDVGEDGQLPDIDDLEDTTESKTLEIPEDLDPTGKNLAVDEGDALAATGKNLELGDDDTDVGIDTSLLDATGQTQILTEDMAVETASDIGATIGDDEKTMLASLDDDDEPTAALSDDAETMLASLDDDDDGEFDYAKTEALPKDMFSSDMSNDDTGEMPGLGAGSTDLDLDLDDLTAALKVSEIGDTVNRPRDDATVEQPRLKPGDPSDSAATQSLAPEDVSGDLHEARTMTEVGTKLDLARAYVDMGDPGGARSILEEVLDEGDDAQKQQARQLLDSLPG